MDGNINFGEMSDFLFNMRSMYGGYCNVVWEFDITPEKPDITENVLYTFKAIDEKKSKKYRSVVLVLKPLNDDKSEVVNIPFTIQQMLNTMTEFVDDNDHIIGQTSDIIYILEDGTQIFNQRVHEMICRYEQKVDTLKFVCDREREE